VDVAAFQLAVAAGSDKVMTRFGPPGRRWGVIVKRYFST
jgi:hypothetical protein